MHMQATSNDPTNQEILEVINMYSTRLENRMSSVEMQIGKLRSDLINHVDKKFLDFRGDMVVLLRGEDVKMRELIKVLHSKKFLDDTEANMILRLEPFPTSL